MLRFCLPIVLMLSMIPAFASDPGQPLDCSDWVFLEPGLSCGRLNSESPGGAEIEVDNDGRVLAVQKNGGADTTLCPGLSVPSGIRLVYSKSDGNLETIAYLRSRCVGVDANYALWDSTDLDRDLTALGLSNRGGFVFDAGQGRVIIPVHTTCNYDDSLSRNNCRASSYDDPNVNAWFVISGFTTTFDILQSYEPTSGPISFRVPYMPEGFAAADWFDTYYGDLATVGDWTQAQPLECEYPATMPAVGDYLTVDDPLPAPPPGQGRYYVTAASYQGQTRFGRKAIGGVLSGRDPAVLPICAPE